MLCEDHAPDTGGHQKGHHHQPHDLNTARQLPLNAEVVVRGRVSNRRLLGKIAFITINDTDGAIQIVIERSRVAEQYEQFLGLCCIGNLVQARGRLIRTRSGELSIDAAQVHRIVRPQCEIPPAGKPFVTDNRSLELVCSRELRQRFLRRSEMCRGVRNLLCAEHFVELDTPILIDGDCGALRAHSQPDIMHSDAKCFCAYQRRCF